MSEYKCILCGSVLKVSERGYRCTDENCKMYYYPLPSEVIKIVDDKRQMLLRQRDEARQIARRMNVERDNARAMYELLKKML